MIYIDDKKGERTWHVGSPFPKTEGRVVSIQADGDELEWLLRAIRAYEARSQDEDLYYDADEITTVR